MIETTLTGSLCVTRVLHQPVTEYFIHTQSALPSQAGELLAELMSFLDKKDARLFNLRVFANAAAHENLLTSCPQMPAKCNCPITCIHQNTNENNYALTLHAHAVTGVQVQPIHLNGRLVGRSYEDASAKYCHFNLLPNNISRDNYAQALGIFDRMQETLQTIGLDFSSAVRTWLFINDILAWYELLNKARNLFFTQHDVFGKLVPASTGVGLGNPFGSALVAELLAVQPLRNNGVQIQKILSPMQCEALDYKSSFSRAVRIDTSDYCRIYISGTAAIAPDGKTAYPDDTAKQIELTMQVVEALIHNAGLNWKNIVRAIAYFKDGKDFPLFDTYCRNADLSLPHVKIEADVCRNDLLFEIELDLIS